MYSKYFQYFDATFILQGLKAIYTIKIACTVRDTQYHTVVLCLKIDSQSKGFRLVISLLCKHNSVLA